ncbi:MAG: response regulator [Phycisphaerales bacterium]|nr:response regulator [Phycisphaerales bacterium]
MPAESTFEFGGNCKGAPWRPGWWRWPILAWIGASLIATTVGVWKLQVEAIRAGRSTRAIAFWSDRMTDLNELDSHIRSLNALPKDAPDRASLPEAQNRIESSSASAANTLATLESTLADAPVYAHEADDDQRSEIRTALGSCRSGVENLLVSGRELLRVLATESTDSSLTQMAAFDRRAAECFAETQSLRSMFLDRVREGIVFQNEATGGTRTIALAMSASVALLIAAISAHVYRMSRLTQTTMGERDEAMRELRARERAIDAASIVAITDLKGRITYANDMFCQLSGYSHEELIGANHRILNSGLHDKVFFKSMYATIASGNIWRGEIRNRAKDGSYYWVDTMIVPMRNSSGSLAGYMSLRIDITEKHESKRKLEEARTQAEAASKAKSDFLANMSHEIRTPITAILGYADLLCFDDFISDTSQAREAARVISSNGRHLLAVINDILDVSKVEAGRLDIERVRFSPHKLVADSVALVMPRATERGLSIKVEYITSTPVMIESDPTRVRQVLLNLLTNALKFTESGGIEVVVSCDKESEAMQIVVKDTGVGMTPEQLELVRRFEPFSQADGSTTRRFGGTGLGLRISHSLASMLGGGLRVDSEYKAGTSVTFTFSTGTLAGIQFAERPESASDPACPIAANAACGEGPALTGRRVLLVEDGPDNQRLIRFYLAKAGAEVEIAENGRVAVDVIAARGNRFDLIVMDMQMPELDGYGATRELRRMRCATPIVALTAHAMDGDRQRCLDAGCDEYLTKPIDRSRLIETCAAMCNGADIGRLAA